MRSWQFVGVMKNTRKLLCALSAYLILPLSAQDPFKEGYDGDPVANNTSERKISTLNKDKEDFKNRPKTILVNYEAFSLPMIEAAALQRSGLIDAQIYKALLKKGKLEVFISTRKSPGSKGYASSTLKQIYPTEFQRPELPNYVGAGLSQKDLENLNSKDSKTAAGIIAEASKAGIAPVTPATPSKFETQLEGATFEAEASLEEDNRILSVRCAIDHTTLVDRVTWGQGVSECQMPLFERATIHAALTVTDGIPTLVGTITPKRELLPENGEPRVWFAFITAKLTNH